MITSFSKILGLLTLLSLGSISSDTFANNDQAQLKGKYLILNRATCAGLKFNAQATAAAWQNDMECSRGYENTNEISPPRHDVYKIMKIQNKMVTVTHYWTGWNTHQPEIQNFKIK